jgi:hypothetical protein
MLHGIVFRHSRSGKNKLAHVTALVNGKAYRVPKNGRFLPFVKKPRRLAAQ